MISENEPKYNWISNIRNMEETHARMCLDAIHADYKITPIAMDITGDILPNHLGIWINTAQYDSHTMLYFDMFFKLCQKYKEYLLASGKVTEDELLGKVTYLGCENEYFPDRKIEPVKEKTEVVYA